MPRDSFDIICWFPCSSFEELFCHNITREVSYLERYGEVLKELKKQKNCQVKDVNDVFW